MKDNWKPISICFVIVICSVLFVFYYVKNHYNIDHKKAYRNIIIDEETKELNRRMAESNKTVILIGDSYGVTYCNKEGNGWIGWAEQFEEMFPSSAVFAEPIGGSGFINNDKGYLRQLKSIIEKYNPQNVNDIIIIGGYNDVGVKEEILDECQQEFVSTANNNWNGISISFMYVPHNIVSIEEEQSIKEYKDKIEKVSKKNDIFFVEKSMNILNSNDDFFIDESDSNSGFHPSTIGARKIAISIAKYILDGEIE